MTALSDAALEIVRKAHAGQKDKAAAGGAIHDIAQITARQIMQANNYGRWQLTWRRLWNYTVLCVCNAKYRVGTCREVLRRDGNATRINAAATRRVASAMQSEAGRR
jgi:hypothetical protein